MKYAAVHRRYLLEQPAARDGDYLAIGVWTLLSVYAADHELGEGPVPTGTDVPVGSARIAGCAAWSDRMWLTSVSVDRFGVDKAVEAGLAAWDGDDLLVRGYDLKGQAAAEAHRAAGRKGGRPKGKNQEVHQKENQAKPKRVTKKEPPTLPSPSLPSPSQPNPAGDAAGAAASVRAVFDHWTAVMGKTNAKLTGDRRQKIQARLREGFSVSDLKRAVDGCKRSTFHMGQNERNQPYNDLTTILKSGKAVEEHAERVAPRSGSSSGRTPDLYVPPPRMSPDEQAANAREGSAKVFAAIREARRRRAPS